MTCPSCGQRRARRACPALGREICPICCGTKRLSEIRCPETCGYLSAARHHPAAVEQRRRERDVEALGETFRGLTEAEQQLTLLLLGVVAAHGAVDTLDRIADEDVVAAAAALASTFETASRGVIYEHRPQSGAAQRLGAALRALVEDLSREAGGRRLEREASIALRNIERGVPAAQRRLGGGRSYVELVQRWVKPQAAMSPAGAPAAATGGIILP